MSKPRGKQHSNVFIQHRDKKKSTTQPVARISQLKGLWNRIFSVYRMVVVQVTARKGSKLTFRILPVGEEQGATNTLESHTVDLDDGDVAWGDLPSTAQLVDPKSTKTIAYLGLSEDWLDLHEPGHRKVAARGTKIPNAESL